MAYNFIYSYKTNYDIIGEFFTFHLGFFPEPTAEHSHPSPTFKTIIGLISPKRLGDLIIVADFGVITSYPFVFGGFTSLCSRELSKIITVNFKFMYPAFSPFKCRMTYFSISSYFPSRPWSKDRAPVPNMSSEVITFLFQIHF